MGAVVSRPAFSGVGGSWLRLGWFAGVVLAAVLVPFALWGDALDAAAPLWLQARDARLSLAVLGIALLVVDVGLPIPSSVIAVALCLSLGPLWGGAAVAAGCLLAFVAGYGLGRLLPEAQLRAWIGAALWDRVREQARGRALWWIVVARPLPVLAEVSALMAGVFRVPPLVAFVPAALASAAVGALYGGSVWIGQRGPGTALLLLTLFAVPTLTWLAHRLVVHRLLRTPAVTADASASSPPSPRSSP